MDTFIDFLVNNYLWFLIIFLIIIFALIGYLVDSVTPKSKSKVKSITNNVNSSERKIHPSVEAYTNDNFDEPLINEKNI